MFNVYMCFCLVSVCVCLNMIPIFTIMSSNYVALLFFRHIIHLLNNSLHNVEIQIKAMQVLAHFLKSGEIFISRHFKD